MSAIPPRADIAQHGDDVREAPIADIDSGCRRMRSPDNVMTTLIAARPYVRKRSMGSPPRANFCRIIQRMTGDWFSGC
jgi:hypothetical protein